MNILRELSDIFHAESMTASGPVAISLSSISGRLLRRAAEVEAGATIQSEELPIAEAAVRLAVPEVALSYPENQSSIPSQAGE